MPTPASLIAPSLSRQRMRWKNLRLRARIYLPSLFLILLTIGLEIVSRAYWAIGRGVPVFRTTRIWNSFYKEWTTSGVDGAPTARNHESYEVLLLGGSTISWSIDEMKSRLSPALQSHMGGPCASPTWPLQAAIHWTAG